jgi:hypothetical protein
MNTVPTPAKFSTRAMGAARSGSFWQLAKLCNDIAKHHFARYLIVDAYATKQLAWTLKGAYAWLPFCAPEIVRIVDTLDFSIVVERRQARVY